MDEKEIADQFWRLQGRVNALEVLMVLEVLNFSKLQPNPFQWIQEYLEAVRLTGKGMIPDVDDPAKAPRLLRETKTALDEFLESLVRGAGTLKGAPGNPIKP